MRLIDYLVKHNLTDEAFAKMVGGVGRHAVKKWRYGERVPDAARIARVEDVTGGSVSLGDWHDASAVAVPTPAVA